MPAHVQSDEEQDLRKQIVAAGLTVLLHRHGDHGEFFEAEVAIPGEQPTITRTFRSAEAALRAGLKIAQKSSARA